MSEVTLLIPHQDLPVHIAPASDARRELSAFNTESLDVSVSFHECGFDGPGLPCREASVRFYKLAEDATVRAAYQSLHDDLYIYAFTPQQLGEFVTKNRAFLHQVGCSSFFLLKEGERIFGGIFIPHKSQYFAVRAYAINSVYVVRAKENYLFLVPEH